jgi:RNA polymerase sigma-70 factor (ECF subfamily)
LVEIMRNLAVIPHGTRVAEGARMREQSNADLVTIHASDLLRRARRLTRNETDALDLVQDTCLNAFEALARMQSPPANMRGWLFVLMRNHWFNIVRHQRVCSSARVELAARGDLDSGLHDTRAVFSQLSRAWGKLSEQAQSIATRCLIEGESHEEVSRRLGMTPGGVAASIHRTREQLRIAMFGNERDECA